MSYSTSATAVDRVFEHLMALESATEDSIFFEVDTPSKFAYQLRQAFFAAKFHDEFVAFHDLKEEWKVYVGVRGVECRRITEGRVTAPPQQVGSVTLKEINEVTGVLGAALRFKKARELVFPNADLSYDAKLKLFNWTATQDWQYIDHMGEGITLTKHEIDLDLLWRPEDE